MAVSQPHFPHFPPLLSFPFKGFESHSRVSTMASATEAPPSVEVATASLVPPPPAAADEGAASLVPPSPAAIDEAAASLVPLPPATTDEAAASLVSPPPADTDEVAASLVPPSTVAADEAVTSLVHPPPAAAVEAAVLLVPNGNVLTLASGSVETNGAVSNGGGAGGEGSSGETLERAAELYEKGLKALKDEDFFEAVDCLSQALEIRAAHHGELAPECAMSYYKYGCALLYKAQEEADPLGVVPKSNPKSTWKDKASTSVDENTSSKTSSVSDSNQDSLSKIEEEEEDGSDEDQDGAKDGSDADNEEGEEEDSDLDMAWKMLELARTIVEKQPEDSMEKVNVYSALGEVSIEREDIETSLSDYLKALSILGRLVEPDSRRIIELNFRICIVLELGSKIGEAIPYCQTAISLCNARLQRLQEDASNVTALTENMTVPVNDTDNGASQSSGKADPSPMTLEKEIELLKNVSVDLERKLEDLQHSLANPRTDMTEVVHMLLDNKSPAAATTSSTEVAKSVSQTSSQLGVNNSCFDSPTVSTAATSGSVTHLGVVGRGVKRATAIPTGAEPSPKRSSLDTTAAKDDSGVSEVVNSTGQDTGSLAE